jgi:hypothetical protein
MFYPMEAPIAAPERSRASPGPGRCHHVAMPELPTRDLASVHLAELLAARGCPGCRERQLVVERYTEAYLYESVNDVRFRADLDTARGMCGEHVREMLRADRRESGGALGPAILLDAMLRVREGELRAAAGARGPIRSWRVREAARPAACLVCAEVSQRVEGVLRHLVRLTADDAWADAVGSAELCLDHLLVMMAAPGRPPAWEGAERRQLERVHRVRERLIAFADHSAHGRRHHQTADERASVEEGAALLGGAERDPGREGGSRR